MSARFNPPLRHSMGSSHFGSAFLLRPMSSRNQTAVRASAPCGSARLCRGGRGRIRARRAVRGRSRDRRLPRLPAGGREARGPAPRRFPRRVPEQQGGDFESSSVGSSLRSGSCKRRRRSSWRISSALGGAAHSTSTLAPAIRLSARRRDLCGTSRTQTPLRPARPVRPERCISASGVVRQVGVDDQTEVGQVEAARGDVGGDADAGAAVAQGLQRVVALALRELARERHDRRSRARRGRRADGVTPSRVVQNTSALGES